MAIEQTLFIVVGAFTVARWLVRLVEFIDAPKARKK